MKRIVHKTTEIRLFRSPIVRYYESMGDALKDAMGDGLFRLTLPINQIEVDFHNNVYSLNGKQIGVIRSKK